MGLVLALVLAGCGTYRAADDPGNAAAARKTSDQVIADATASYRAELDRQEAERKARAEAGKALCAKKGGVGVGMTRAQVYASCWGKPEKINITTTAGVDHEQLVYPGWQYVYLRNGVVTAIQTSR